MEEGFEEGDELDRGGNNIRNNIRRFRGGLIGDTITMNPSIVEIQDISTGITNKNYNLKGVKLYIVDAPANARIQYAIYEDDDIIRDGAPHNRLSTPQEIVVTSGWNEFTLPQSILLKHTKKYYVLFKAQTLGIRIEKRDVRSGVIPTAGPIPLKQNFEEQLHKGKRVVATIKLNGINAQDYCVLKGFNDPCEPGIFDGVELTDAFFEYAVHIYRFD